MDFLGISTSAKAVLLIAILIWIAAARKYLARVYQNVIYMMVMLSSPFTVNVGALRAAAAGAIMLPLASLVAMGLIRLVKEG